MTSGEHKKHAKVKRPGGGKFHFNELAFIGAPCGEIQQTCSAIIQQLDAHSFGFVDADHLESADKPLFQAVYTNKISHHNFSFYQEEMEFDFRAQFSKVEMVLVNGNHFGAEKQVVFIHEKKKESLQRKLDRLTNVAFFILAKGQEDIYDFLKAHHPEFDKLPKYKIDDKDSIASAVQEMILESAPPIHGLVLAGGQSLRMGKDKGSINYHGKPQRLYTAELLSSFCSEVYLSVRDKDKEELYPQLIDSFADLGPFGGILSAFRYNPDAAWLTVATDIPLLNQETLQRLINNRDPRRMATCFYNPETGFPEPLITLWEPRAYPRMLYFLSLGYSCPRKVLINSEINMVRLDTPEVLFNANTPEEREMALRKLSSE